MPDAIACFSFSPIITMQAEGLISIGAAAVSRLADIINATPDVFPLATMRTKKKEKCPATGPNPFHHIVPNTPNLSAPLNPGLK